MARFLVDQKPEAEEELAALLMNSPPSLQRQITDASNAIYAKLVHADLLPNYPRRRRLASTYTWIVFPLLAEYEVDEQSKTVTILHYYLAPRIHRP
jgi:hypothetical protein